MDRTFSKVRGGLGAGPQRAIIVLLGFLLPLMLVLSISAQSDEAVPTLVPPTPLPTATPEAVNVTLASSGVTRIRERGTLRVGVLYNEPPFVTLSIRGDVIGYEADLARAIAEAWGVELEFVQVTRQNALDHVERGQVDLVMAAQVHRRERDGRVSFSQTYHVGQQAMMVRADEASAEVLVNMAGRRVGAVMGTAGADALNAWLERTQTPVTVQTYLTFDQAATALFAGEVDGVVGRYERLLRVVSAQPDAVRFLQDPVAPEPIAAALHRDDEPLRQLLNRTLQHLLDDGTLEDLHAEYFPGRDFNRDVLPLWDNLGASVPPLDQVSASLNPSTVATLPRLRAEGVVRVAGMGDPSSDLGAFHQRLVDRLARRWGVRVQAVNGDPLTAIVNGQADLGVGMAPDWALADRVDFSAPYLMHGDRLMVPSRSNIDSFNELRGRWVGIFASDPPSEGRAQDWASSINTTIRIFRINRDEEAVLALNVNNNADAIYGDSLKLMPHVLGNPQDVRLTERWYSRDYMALALPRGDRQFRLLVTYTLQEMVRDGTLATLTQPITPPESEPPAFDVWPGPSEMFGFNLAG